MKYYFLRFFWLFFLVFSLGTSGQAMADEKESPSFSGHSGLSSGISGICGEVLSERCNVVDAHVPPTLEAFRNVYIVSEEGNKQLYQGILEWNNLEQKRWDLTPELENRMPELQKQLLDLKNQVSTGGGVTLTKTSNKGVYCSVLPPGKYFVGAENNKWVFVEVKVETGKVQRVVLTIPLDCG